VTSIRPSYFREGWLRNRNDRTMNYRILSRIKQRQRRTTVLTECKVRVALSGRRPPQRWNGTKEFLVDPTVVSEPSRAPGEDGSNRWEDELPDVATTMLAEVRVASLSRLRSSAVIGNAETASIIGAGSSLPSSPSKPLSFIPARSCRSSAPTFPKPPTACGRCFEKYPANERWKRQASL